MMEMEKDVGLSAAATPLERGNEMILAHMERVMKSLDMAIAGGDFRECAYSAQAMQCLHSELRKSATIPQAQTAYTLTDENCQKLCARMVEMAREANRTREASYSMYQLQGAEIALRCLGIPCNVDFAPDICKRISVTVGGITMDVDSSE